MNTLLHTLRTNAFEGSPALFALAAFAVLLLPGGIPLVTLWVAYRVRQQFDTPQLP